MIQSIKKTDFFVFGKRMSPYVRPYLWRSILALVLCIPIGSLDAAIAWSLKPFMDMVLLEKSMSDMSSWYVPAFIIAITFLHAALNYAATYLNVWVGSRITNNLKATLFKKLLGYEPAYFDRTSSGDVVFRYNNDADLACAGLLNNLKLFLTRLFSSLALIFVLFLNSWQLALMALFVLGCMFYPISRVRELIKKIVSKTVNAAAQTITAYNETFAGNKTIMAYNYQEAHQKNFEGVLSELFRLSIKMTQRSSWLSPAMHVIVSFGIAGTIWYGSYLILNGQLTPGGFVSFISALLMLYTPLRGIGNNYIAVQNSIMAMERVFEILDGTPSIQDKSDAVELDGVRQGVEFKDVSFSYREDVPVLKHINLQAHVGETVALVGNSGGGKSTIVSLLPRFYDVNSGSIQVDGIDIRDITLKSLRDQIAVVFQDNFLFSGTIRENILIGRSNASDDQIRKALDMAYLSEFVDSLENGLDTNIGERGMLLSGGQKQRLAIARAFVKDAPIIILDEATSALDNKAEAIVQKAIDNLMKDKTVFVIAHRLSTVQNADRIIVVNQGEIVETGTHNELMQDENGAYRALYNAQFKSKESSRDNA